jgi:hypothetical protein
MRYSAFAQSRRCPAVELGALAILTAVIASPATADDRPPIQAASPPPMTAASTISAGIEFGVPALDQAIERHVPRRLATFNDRETLCWHRRIFRREVDIDCEYSGFVERTSAISLRAEHGRLEAAVPIYGRIEGQGVGRFARLLHGTGEGALMVYATARPRLRPDWSVALDMGEGFRWQEPPVLMILGHPFNVSRFVEPRIREQLARINGEATAYLRGLDLRGKAEAAWRQAFVPVKIFDGPDIWLQMTPQSVAFAGMHAYGNVLEGTLDMNVTTQTVVGTEPASNPTPLPALRADVSEPGRFDVVIPFVVNYDALRAKIQEAARALNEAGVALRDVKIYPSGNQIVIGLRINQAGGDTGDGNWVYLTATPHPQADDQTIQFPDVSLSNPGPSIPPAVADWFKDESHTRALKQQLALAYRDGVNKIIASANTRLTRPLANGFRSEAHLTATGAPSISLLTDGLRADFHIGGEFKILYGL